MKIKLLTQFGEFVRDAEILPFDQYPSVMIWGDRVFQHSNIQGEYRECFHPGRISRMLLLYSQRSIASATQVKSDRPHRCFPGYKRSHFLVQMYSKVLLMKDLKRSHLLLRIWFWTAVHFPDFRRCQPRFRLPLIEVELWKNSCLYGYLRFEVTINRPMLVLEIPWDNYLAFALIRKQVGETINLTPIDSIHF